MKGKKNFQLIAVGLIIGSLILTGVSTTMSWGVVDTDLKLAGLADGHINLDLGQYKGTADVQFNVTGGGLLGGLGGSIIGGAAGGIIGDTSSMGGERDIHREAVYLTDMGQLNDVFGILFTSFKDVTYKVTAQTFNGLARLTIQTKTDTVPWYPEGMGQRYTVTITLVEIEGNFSKVEVDNVWMRLNYDLDTTPTLPEYTQAKKIGEISPDTVLTQKNQSVSYSFDVTNNYDKEQIGVIGLVELTMYDSIGGEHTPSLPPTPNINIYPISQIQSAQIVMLALSFPMTIIGLALGAVGIPLTLLKKKLAFIIILSAFIMSLLGVVFFILGAETLVSLLVDGLDTFERSAFTWHSGMYMALAGALLLAPATALMWIARPPKPEKKGKKAGVDKDPESNEGTDKADGPESDGEAEKEYGVEAADEVDMEKAPDAVEGGEEILEMKLIEDD